MAFGLGAIGAGASICGSIFGGGGARQPRMNGAQKELMMSQANLNNAMAERIRNGGNGCQQAQQGCFGNQCPQHQCGRIGNQGMNGCGNGGWGQGPMQQIMGGMGQLFDMMSGFGGGGCNGFGGGCGFGGGGCFGGGGWGGGGFPGGCCGNQNGINLNFNL
jgi:hypothetical protein